jgi:lipopolysaccharide export LptBFGC system permease protein LptF
MFSILSRYLALEFLRFFALFLLAFVAITSLGNLVNDLNQAFDSWSGFLAFLRQTCLVATLAAGIDHTCNRTTRNHCSVSAHSVELQK